MQLAKGCNSCEFGFENDLGGSSSRLYWFVAKHSESVWCSVKVDNLGGIWVYRVAELLLFNIYRCVMLQTEGTVGEEWQYLLKEQEPQLLLSHTELR